MKRLRKRLGLSQEQLAQTIGITRDRVAAYEIGRTDLPLDVKSKLESLGMVAVEESRAVYEEPPMAIRATRSQLKLLIKVISDPNTPADTREMAVIELEKALGPADL